MAEVEHDVVDVVVDGRLGDAQLPVTVAVIVFGPPSGRRG